MVGLLGWLVGCTTKKSIAFVLVALGNAGMNMKVIKASREGEAGESETDKFGKQSIAEEAVDQLQASEKLIAGELRRNSTYSVSVYQPYASN